MEIVGDKYEFVDFVLYQLWKVESSTKEMGLYCQSQNMGGQNLSLMEQANIALVILW